MTSETLGAFVWTAGEITFRSFEETIATETLEVSNSLLSTVSVLFNELISIVSSSLFSSTFGSSKTVSELSSATIMFFCCSSSWLFSSTFGLSELASELSSATIMFFCCSS